MEYHQDNLHIYNMDCMELMKKYPDKYFDLAIVDPPYGINRAGQKESFTKNKKHKRKYFENKKWDHETPNYKYFKELFRISKNQIIWGGNYFTKYLPSSMGWIFWDKGQELSMSDGELAFTSFDKALRRILMNRVQLLKEGDTIHPTQKPVALYSWILEKYSKPEYKIIDTHLGSGSNAIANHYFKTSEFVASELDPDYYQASIKRIKKETAQLPLF